MELKKYPYSNGRTDPRQCANITGCELSHCPNGHHDDDLLDCPDCKTDFCRECHGNVQPGKTCCPEN